MQPLTWRNRWSLPPPGHWGESVSRHSKKQVQWERAPRGPESRHLPGESRPWYAFGLPIAKLGSLSTPNCCCSQEPDGNGATASLGEVEAQGAKLLSSWAPHLDPNLSGIPIPVHGQQEDRTCRAQDMAVDQLLSSPLHAQPPLDAVTIVRSPEWHWCLGMLQCGRESKVWGWFWG